MDTPKSPTSPKRSRGFSVKSDKSDKSGSTSHKRGLSETSQEKARRNLHTKADPLVAMNELQPSTSEERGWALILARSHSFPFHVN